MQQLLEFKVDVNALGDVGGVMASPLCAAAMNGHAEVVRLLLAAGADIDGQLTQGTNAVDSVF